MERRERFDLCINHKNTDRIPIDFTGTPQTTYEDFSIIEKIALELNIKVFDENEIKEKVLKYLNVDFRNVGFILKPESDLVKSGENWHTDFWGVTRKWTGMYWDISNYPLKDASIADLDNFSWPQANKIDKKIFTNLRERAKRLWNDTDFVIVGEHPTYGILELGCWMCSFDDFLYRLVGEPEFAEKFFSKVYEYQKDVIDLYYTAIGDYIQVTTSGDDFGTQNGPFMSPDTFSEMISPWYKKRIALTKQYTKAKYFHHTCGSIYRLLDNIIEMGVDILNPLQPNVFEMDYEIIKQKYGDKITFWGGIDEQGLLTNGTTEEVKKNVKEVVKLMGENGGYIMAPSHNIQADVPIENIIAMYNSIRE